MPSALPVFTSNRPLNAHAKSLLRTHNPPSTDRNVNGNTASSTMSRCRITNGTVHAISSTASTA